APGVVPAAAWHSRSRRGLRAGLFGTRRVALRSAAAACSARDRGLWCARRPAGARSVRSAPRVRARTRAEALAIRFLRLTPGGTRRLQGPSPLFGGLRPLV